MDKTLIVLLSNILALQQKIAQTVVKIETAVHKEEWLDSADIKAVLKITDRTLYRLRKKNALEYKKISGKYYYKL